MEGLTYSLVMLAITQILGGNEHQLSSDLNIILL